MAEQQTLEEDPSALTKVQHQGTMIEEAAEPLDSVASSIGEDSADYNPLFLYSEIESAAKKVLKGKRFRPTDFPSFDSFSLKSEERSLTALGRFAVNRDLNVIRLFEDILNDAYQLQPYFGFTIPRKNKKPRAILSPHPRDRIVFTATLKKIENQFGEMSALNILGSGTNKRLNNPRVIFADILKHSPEFCYVVKIDVQDFFPSINKEKLLRRLESVVVDKRILRIIESSFYNPIRFLDPRRDTPYFKNPSDNIGIPQGCAYSPLLANYYFSRIDQILKNKSILSYRYLDDMLVFAHEWKEAKYAHDFITNEAGKIDLTVHPIDGNKSYIASVDKPFEYLGIVINSGHLFIPDSQVDRFKEHVVSQIINQKLLLKFGATAAFVALALYIQGWKEYYSKIAPLNYERQKTLINEWLFDYYEDVFCEDERILFLSSPAAFLP